MAEYDQMGNYTGYDSMDYNYQPVAPSYDSFGEQVLSDEEQRKRDEELQRQIEEYQRKQDELASEVSHKQEVTTYADGSRTVKTTNEIPAGQTQRPQPVAPVSPDYNQRIQQQESGARPNIGYHNQQLGTAYGPYGTTAAGWQDARRLNPNLPADITQATPEQLTAGQNAYTQQNAKYLQSYGVPVNENTLGAAHFLGAKGLSDYLKTGYISPQAAQANGGVERVKQIVQQRLGGTMAPASGAVQPVSPEQAAPAQTAEAAPVETPRMQPNSYDDFGNPVYSPQQAELDQHLKTYESIQNDPKALMNFEGPEWMKNNAKMRAADLLSNQRDEEKALQSIRESSPKDIARTMMREPTDRWEVIKKSAMFRLLGANDLANKELEKISTPVEKYVQGADGKPYLVKQTASGEITEGYNAETGAKLSDKELVSVGAGIQTAKGTHQSAEVYKDPSGQVKGSFVLETRAGATPVYKEVGTGRIATAQESAVLNKTGVAGTLDMQRAQQIQKQNIDLAGDWAKLQMRVAGAAPEAANKFIGEFNAKHGTNFGIQNLSGAAPQISMETGAMVQAAPATAAAAPAQVAPVTAPAAGAKITPVAPGAAPAQAPAARPAVTAVSPAEVESQRKTAEEQRKAALEVGTAEQKEFVTKAKPEISDSASNGQAIGSIRRQQMDLIKKNPSILNIMNGDGTQYDKARNVIVRAMTGAYGNEEKEQLYKDIKATGMGENEQAALQDFLNLNTTINAKTLKANSGAGAISNAEQAANKEANIGNVDRIPVYAALSGLNRSQFSGDLSASKQQFLEQHPELTTTSAFNAAWQREEATRLKEYQAIAKARFDVMGRPPAAGASAEAIKAYRDRVFRAFEAYPAPQFDATTGKWNYQTANARRAAMAAILGQ